MVGFLFGFVVDFFGGGGRVIQLLFQVIFEFQLYFTKVSKMIKRKKGKEADI